MVWTVDIWSIITDYLRPYHMGEGRRFRILQVTAKVGVPTVIAVALTIAYPSFSRDAATPLFTVFGVSVAVMTALLPIVQAVVGGTTMNSDIVRGSPQWNYLKAKSETLREIYAAIGWSVLTTLCAMLALTVVSLLPLPKQGEAIPRYVTVIEYAGSLVAFWAALVATTSLLQILGGVYLVLLKQLEELDDQLNAARK